MKKSLPLSYVVAFLIILSTLSACSDDPSHNSDVGAIGLKLNWREHSEGRSTSDPTKFDDCSIRGVDTVTVAVRSPTGAKPLKEKSWPCEKGSGSITGITPGNDLIVEIHALDAEDNVKYEGRIDGITVSGGKTVSVEATLEAVAPTFTVSMVKDIFPGAKGSYPHHLKPLENRLFFVARRPDTGFELFVTDGTDTGTQLVKDIHSKSTPAPYSGPIPEPFNLTEMKGKLYFFADDGTNGPGLWQTDGTAENTFMVEDLTGRGISNPSHLTALDDKLFFAAENEKNGRELWMTHGTKDAQMVEDIFPGEQSSTPHELVALDEWLYFVAADDDNGIEIWRSNGDHAELIQDINTVKLEKEPHKTKDSFASELTVVNGRIFCRANDGTSGEEIWIISDSANLVKNLNASSEGSGSSQPRSLTTVSDTYLAFSAEQTVAGEEKSYTGNELWIYDWQKDSEPIRVTDIVERERGSNPENMVSMGGVLYFTANNQRDENHLWALALGKESPPECLTRELADPAPQHLTVVNGLLYFSVFDDASGRELWYSNGATAARIEDLCPGACSSSPTDFTAVGDRLYFSAHSKEHGKEMYHVIHDHIVGPTAAKQDERSE